MTVHRPLLRSLAVPVSLLLGSLALVQWHSIAFWSRASGVELGWLWSVLIEAAALWLWFLTGRPAQGWAEARRWGLRLAAVTATALLLAGPLHQVSRPVWSDVALREHEAIALADQRQRTAAELAELRRENGELERNLAQFRANSAERVGWLGAIEGAQASLGRNQVRIRELLASPRTLGAAAAPAALSWLGVAVIGMQAIALLLFQLVNILAITTVARRLAQAVTLPVSAEVVTSSPAQEPVTPAPVMGSAPTSEPPVTPLSEPLLEKPVTPAPPAPEEEPVTAPDEFSVLRLQRSIHDTIAKSGLSTNAWCTQERVNKKYLWLLFNHTDHTREGKETLTPAKLDALRKRFLPTAEERR